MQSAMKTMMNTQFSDHLPSEALKDSQEPLLLLPQEELNSNLQQNTESPSPPSPLPPPPPPPPAPSDIAKDEVIGMVTRAHKDTFMYNQEQTENPPTVGMPQYGEIILQSAEQYTSSSEPEIGEISHHRHGENEQHFNGQHNEPNSMHYPNVHNLQFTNKHYMNYTNGFALKSCHRMPENGFPPNEPLNAYSFTAGGRMHLVM